MQPLLALLPSSPMSPFSCPVSPFPAGFAPAAPGRGCCCPLLSPPKPPRVPFPPQDPSWNHRVYRLAVAKMSPPIIPFMPLLLKGGFGDPLGVSSAPKDPALTPNPLPQT